MFLSESHRNNWLTFVKEKLFSLGFGNIWINQNKSINILERIHEIEDEYHFLLIYVHCVYINIINKYIKHYVLYEGCSKSFANRYTENTQSIGI